MPNRGFIFNHGPMGSGKTLELMRRRFDYHKYGKQILVAKHSKDTKAAHRISTRVDGVKDIPCDVLIGDKEGPYKKMLLALGKKSLQSAGIVCVFVDEVQFLSEEQIDDLYDQIVLEEQIEVQAYGLTTDFIGSYFPGSKRSLELANSVKLLETICPCSENNNAEYNTRYENGMAVFAGSQVSIDGIDSTYTALCKSCYQSELLKAYYEGRAIDDVLKPLLIESLA